MTHHLQNWWRHQRSKAFDVSARLLLLSSNLTKQSSNLTKQLNSLLMLKSTDVSKISLKITNFSVLHLFTLSSHSLQTKWSAKQSVFAFVYSVPWHCQDKFVVHRRTTVDDDGATWLTTWNRLTFRYTLIFVYSILSSNYFWCLLI